ncbi:YiiG family protein [Rhizobium rhizogenes]|uniref:YiiG family protein n=1 Tax=Rhizobium rhizogenes TaxID=359 RepID=UPI003ECF8C42
MKTSASVAILAMAFTAILGLSACDDQSNSTATRNQSSADTAAKLANSAKLNDYVLAYNDLIGDSGLLAQYQAYQNANISKSTTSDNITEVSKGSLEQSADKLKTVRGAKSDAPTELDTAADKLISALGQVVPRLSGLDVYYASKAYMEDGLARGKREDPLMLADFQAAAAALEEFHQQLQKELDRREQAELAKIKERGDMPVYQTRLALSQARQLVDLFNSSEDPSKPALQSQIDAKIVELEKTLEDQRTALAKAKQDGGSSPNTPLLDGINTFLTGMVGDFRQIKQNPTPDKYQLIITRFNGAIEMFNSVR